MNATNLSSATYRRFPHSKSGIRAAVGGVLLSAGLAACGSSSSTPTTTSSHSGSGTSSTGTSGAATVTTVTNSTLGTILVNSAGATVYRFDADSASPPTSHCTGSCAAAWPPVPAGSASPTAQGFPQSELGSIKRADGTTQVTVNGWPLYTFTGDKAPGQANGQHVTAFGATWWAVTTSGARASASPGASSSTTGTGPY
jgi:predicted lipoprotein with Yx(FWY)xxD motif